MKEGKGEIEKEKNGQQQGKEKQGMAQGFTVNTRKALAHWGKGHKEIFSGLVKISTSPVFTTQRMIKNFGKFSELVCICLG